MPPRVFVTELMVRSHEVDYWGVVNNAVFVNYLEHARMEIFRELGLPVAEWIRRGVLVVVRRLEVDYRRAARLEDRLRVESWIEEIGRTSVRVGQRVLGNGDTPLVAATIVGVFVDRAMEPTPVPGELRAALPPEAVGALP
jgi:YbgC/YbaW family acyl-CoA thioester hydrolase